MGDYNEWRQYITDAFGDDLGGGRGPPDKKHKTDASTPVPFSAQSIRSSSPSQFGTDRHFEQLELSEQWTNTETPLSYGAASATRAMNKSACWQWACKGKCSY